MQKKKEEIFRAGRNKLNETKTIANISVVSQRVSPEMSHVLTTTIPIKKKTDLGTPPSSLQNKQASSSSPLQFRNQHSKQTTVQ